MDGFGPMAEAAANFTRRLRARPGATLHPVATPALQNHPGGERGEWTNVLLSDARFRHAHVETFAVPGRVRVLHVCLFPRLDDATGVFGFDMVAGSSRVTGIFLDLSPVTPASPKLSDLMGRDALAGFAAPRALPDWGAVFSPEMVAIRPADDAEIGRAIDLADAVLTRLLDSPKTPADAAAVAAGQARYVAAQRRNEHTLRMLAGFVGAEPARRFVDEVLFPAVA